MADKVMGSTTNPGRMLHSTAISSTAGAPIKREAQPEPAQGEWLEPTKDNQAIINTVDKYAPGLGVEQRTAFFLEIHKHHHTALAAARREERERCARILGDWGEHQAACVLRDAIRESGDE